MRSVTTSFAREKSEFNRDSRFDFMKVVAMVFIVLWHINQHASVNGGLRGH